MTIRARWIALGLFGLVLAPELSSAHAFLVRSSPARRSVLFRVPARVQLWFNERLEPQFSSLSVWNQEGTQVDLGDAEVGPGGPKRLSVGIPPLPPGTYTVRYRVLSVDGHVVDDQFLFTLKESR